MRPSSGLVSRLFQRALACGFVLLLSHAALADVRDFRFQRVTGDHGLVQNTVSALLQDRDGYIWVGTQGGLHRYDGQDYKLFVQASDDPSSLPDNFVTALAEGAPGTLWVGTNSAYVAELNLASGKFRRLLPSELDHPGELGKRVLAMHFDAGHGLWIATEGGIDLLDPATGQRRSILRQPLAAASRNSYGFASDPKGDLWATLPSGLYKIDPVTLTTRKIPAPPGVADVESDRKGGLWVSADGLYRLDPASGKLERSALSFGTGKDADTPQRIAVDAKNRLWLATLRSGLLRFDPASGKTVWIRANGAQEDSLPEDQVNALLVDRSGLLWVGTFTDGVVATDPDGSRFAFITDSIPGHAQRYTNSIRSLFQSPDGALWVGTDGDGVKRYDLAADRFTGFADVLHAAVPADQATSDIRVYAVQPDGDGALWLGTNLGLYWLDPARGRARAQPLDVGTDAANAPLNVRSLARTPNGGLWVGTQNHGLIELDAAGKQVLHLDAGAQGLSNATVNCLYLDARGVLWIGTMDGLDRRDAGGRISHFLNDPHDAATLSGNRVRAIVPTRDGSLWVGTHSGLNRLRVGANGSIAIKRYAVGSDPDHPDTVYGIVEDSRARLWVSSNDGLLRLDPSSGAIRRFTPNDGLQNLEFNGGAFLPLADGRIAFGGIRGLNVFDPARIADNLYEPPVVLTGTRIGSDPTDRVGLVAPTALRLRAVDGVLRLRFSALDFANPSGIAYRYRLEGFDKDWIDAGQRPDATYTNLDAGDYVFHAQVTNGDGQWSHNELRIPITVVPPWWDSVPAHIVYVLLVVGAFAVGWRILQQRHRREAAFSQAIERREQQLKMALWGSGDDYWDLDLTTSMLRRSTAGNSVSRGGIDPIPLAQWRDDVLHPDDMVDVEERLDRHLRGEIDHFESEHRVRHPRTGEWVTILARGKVVERDLDGKPLRISGTARDVSQTQHQERERLIAGEVLSSMSEAVSVIDLHYQFVSVNRAFTLTTGYTEDEIVGQDATVLDSSQHAPEFYREMRETLELTGRWSGEMWQRRKDGEEFLCAIEAVEVLEPNGQRGHFVVVLNDITEKKRAEQELRYLANFDTLTGLPNRALLSERLARAIVRARRHDTMVAVLFLDLDRFKEINDSLGHTAGDRILKAVASRLQATTSPTDTVSRLGGDEFTVVVEDIASDEAAYQVARNILAAFARPLIVDERSEVTITPSIGISLYPAHGLAPTDLLKHADTAMYQAKAIGRNTYLAYTEAMETQTRQRANITAALRRAVDRNEFQLLYQPRLSLARGRISGCEALLRWHSEELGEMMPGDFIPIAEETGMIVRIGEWALREACKTLAIWQREGLTDVRIAVNVSVLQLLRGNLPQLIAQILAESGAQPACLELELTETMIMANAAETRSIFDQLRDMGLSLAIDDFGTGYSSLVYLKQLPIDMLKIDKEFISDLTSDPDDEAITTTIITMAHSLGLTVIAEGVESQDQLDFLREHACDEIQGYWLSQPLSEQHCRTFIHSWHHTTPRHAAGTATAY